MKWQKRRTHARYPTHPTAQTPAETLLGKTQLNEPNQNKRRIKEHASSQNRQTPDNQVVLFLIKPATEDYGRCRFGDLPWVKPFTGPASVFVSPCWGGRWGDLVAAACVGAKPGRYVWIDIVAVRQWPGNVADLNFRAVIHRCRAFVVAVAPRGRLSGVVKKMSELSGTFTETSSRTGPQKKCAGKFLTGDLFAVVQVDFLEL